MDVPCIRFTDAGDTSVITTATTVSIDPPTAGMVQVRVRATGVNRGDILQRRGFYPAPQGAPADIPGLEFAGSVVEAGAEVTRWQNGDRVMGIVAGGAMAELINVAADAILPIPQSLSFDKAAAIPEVFLTAHDAIEQTEVESGQTLLVHACGSGVGTAALQLARLRGLHVIGTSRSPEKLERCRPLGLLEGIVARDKSFADHVTKKCDGIIDLVGAAYLAENLKVMATRGTMVVVGLLGGARGELPLGLLLAKRARIIGTVLRSRSSAEKVALAESFLPLLAQFDKGALVPVLDRCFEWREIAAAHDYLESNESFGKVVLTW